MTTTAERQMELTLPMVPDIEIAAARAAGNLAREIGMSAENIDEMAEGLHRIYGAAASVMILLLWIYFSTQIFLFGARFTWHYANRFGSRAKPAGG